MGTLDRQPDSTHRIVHAHHAAYFYETEDYLIDAACRFLGTGFVAGEPAILIATPAHRDRVEGHFRNLGIDLERVAKDGRWVSLDAAAALEQFMVEGRPNAIRFATVMGEALAETQSYNGQQVRAFGEMVALLWAEGNATGALELEGLWNDLAQTSSFSLLCAYPLAGFRVGIDEGRFLEVCGAHARLDAVEGDTTGRAAHERWRSLARLRHADLART